MPPGLLPSRRQNPAASSARLVSRPSPARARRRGRSRAAASSGRRDRLSTPAKLLLSDLGPRLRVKQNHRAPRVVALHAKAGSRDERRRGERRLPARPPSVIAIQKISGSATTKYCFEPSAAPRARPDTIGRLQVTSRDRDRARRTASRSIRSGASSSSRVTPRAAGTAGPKPRSAARKQLSPHTASTIHDARLVHLGSPNSHVLDA